MENDYKVRWLQDNEWKVVTVTEDYDHCREHEETHYSGSLSDCEAWIRLTNGGYMS